jgi:Fe-S-cluster containining protein
MKKIDWQCKMCGNCCITEEAELMEEEIKTIRNSTDRDDFWIRDGTARTGYKIKHENGKCVFLNEKRKCSIYSIRPVICRTYPFVLEETEINGRSVMLVIPRITGTEDNKITCNGFKWGKMNKKVALKAAKRFISGIKQIEKHDS